MLEVNPDSFVLLVTTKLRQMNSIINETIRFKLGLSKHTCKVRNLLHILGGELELYCDIDISAHTNKIVQILDEVYSEEKWKKLMSEYLSLYELILNCCI